MRSVGESLRQRISRHGRITFSEFVEAALYSPEGGYYASVQRPIGAEGDFYTSPAAHPAFGACLALQLHQMWEELGCPCPFYVVELGAGDGRLCRDITSYAAHVGQRFAASIRYILIDRAAYSSGRREPTSDAQMRLQCIQASGVPIQPVVGCILANELFDALPVHRVMMDRGKLREIYVTVGCDGEFSESVGELATPALKKRFMDLDVHLDDGDRTEVNLGIGPIVAEAAMALQRGFLLTIDYGHLARRLYSHERLGGTMRCYYKHTLNTNPYQRVGLQDISVHVDFDTLIKTGEEAGLYTHGFTTQRDFLMNLGLGVFLDSIERPEIPVSERIANRIGMQELIKVEGLGSFKVLVQGKNVGRPQLHGFHPGNQLQHNMEENVVGPDVPLSTARHMPFGRSRHVVEKGLDLQKLWD